MMSLRLTISAGLSALALSLVGLPALAKTVVYVSNATDGEIGMYDLDPATGALTSMGRAPAAKVVMPMAVAPDKRHLYAVVRSEPMRVLTYAIDPRSGILEAAGEAPLPDSMPYVSTDRTGRFLFTASYSGHKVAVTPIDADGRVTRSPTQIVPTGQHAHAIQADRSNRFVFATNLGSDQIAQFTFDAAQGRLAPNDPPYLKTAKGEGPRHFQFSPDSRFLYLLSELTGTLTQFALDSVTGTLSPTSSVASVPPDSGLVQGTIQPPVTAATLAARAQNDAPPPKPAIAAADIQITPDGRFLVTTERTSSKLAVFRLDPATGTPTFVSRIATVTRPRGIRIDPRSRYLIASGEKSDDLAVYRVDWESGDLREVGRYPGGRGANWVEIVDLPAR